MADARIDMFYTPLLVKDGGYEIIGETTEGFEGRDLLHEPSQHGLI